MRRSAGGELDRACLEMQTLILEDECVSLSESTGHDDVCRLAFDVERGDDDELQLGLEAVLGQMSAV